MWFRVIVFAAVVVLLVVLLCPPTSAFGKWIAGAFDRFAKAANKPTTRRGPR